MKKALASIAILSALGSCATGVSRVNLADPMSAGPGVPTGKHPSSVKSTKRIATLALRRVRDRRPDISCLGVKKNAYGASMGKVDLPKGVQFLDVFKAHLKSCFAKSGFPLEDVGVGFLVETSTPSSQRYPVIVEVDVRSFWTEFMPGFLVVDASSDVQIEVTFFNATTEREIWSEVFRGEGLVSGGFVTARMFEQSLNNAHRQTLHRLRDSLTTKNVVDIVSRQTSSGGQQQ